MFPRSKYLAVVFFSLLCSALIPAQSSDTAFTIYGTILKVTKQFPNAELVVPKLPKDVQEKKDIVYISYGSRKMHLDIYSPVKKNKLYPAVLLIHGGGWRSGNRQMEIPMALFLASHGYVAVTVDYRLSPEALYPAALIDIKAAVKWLRANSTRYHINTNKIALYGCSSGGQLVALLGTSNENQSLSVQAVIDIDGVLDMTDPNESAKDTDSSKPSSGKRWFGYSFQERPDLWKEASALNYVNANSAPICFINSSLPRFHAGRDQMITKLNKLGIYSEVHTVPDTPHEFWLFHPWFDVTSEYIIKFLDKLFLPH